ncbi:MAG: hypothetical protein WA691_08335 [Thermoplasmata archaeon]
MVATSGGNGDTPPSAPSRTEGTPIPGGRRRWIWPTLVIVVVVLAVVAALFATGIVRFGQPNSSSPAYEIFSQAESTAQSGANSVAGGPWYAAFGAGVSTPDAVLEPTTNLSGLLQLVNCTITWTHGEPANIAIPATAASASTGAAAYWTFGLKNDSNALLVETVSDGTPSAVFVASGSNCTRTVALLSTFPAGTVDSPQVISAANAVGGAGFLAAHPNSTEVWGAIAGFSDFGISTSPLWYVEYTACALPSSIDATGPFFNATVGGTSGVVTMHSNGTANCALSVPTGLALALHDPASPAAARKAI